MVPPWSWQTTSLGFGPVDRWDRELRWRSQGRSVSFTYTDGRLVSDSLHLCGFVYLVGEDEGELAGPITIDGLVTLH